MEAEDEPPSRVFSDAALRKHGRIDAARRHLQRPCQHVLCKSGGFMNSLRSISPGWFLGNSKADPANTQKWEGAASWVESQ